MQLGLNQNVVLKGITYHIQTEDGGIKNPVITTVVFREGTILATQKTSYADILKFDKLVGVVKELMNEQHTRLLKQIKQGQFEKGPRSAAGTGKPGAGKAAPATAADARPGHATADKKPAAQPPEEKPLDDIILELLSLDREGSM